MPHLTRYYMYKRIGEAFKAKMRGRVLGISGIDFFRQYIDTSADIVDARYPQVDMQALSFDNESFDSVISDQVLEHLYDPQKAVDESYRVLKRGGIAVHTSCFMNGIHLYPIDLWRFSPSALQYLCRNFSKVIQCQGWGNRIALFLCCAGNRFRSMRIPERTLSFRHWVATVNEPCYPIVSWIIAVK